MVKNPCAGAFRKDEEGGWGVNNARRRQENMARHRHTHTSSLGRLGEHCFVCVLCMWNCELGLGINHVVTHNTATLRK